MMVNQNHDYLYHFNKIGIYRFSLKNIEDKDFILFLQQKDLQNIDINDLNIFN